MVGFVKHVFLEQFDFMLQVYLSHVLSWEGVHGRGAWTVQQCISAACCCSMFFCLCFLGGCTAMEPFIASREPMEAVLFAWRLQLESR